MLVRPSYVLSGAAMNVVRSEAELKGFLDMAVEEHYSKRPSNVVYYSSPN